MVLIFGATHNISSNKFIKETFAQPCVPTNQIREELVNLFEAIPTVRITSSCLQENHKKEKLFGMFNAKHGKGIRAGFDLELTCIMLSRALFVN